jgi:hypothetical protein
MLVLHSKPLQAVLRDLSANSHVRPESKESKETDEAEEQGSLDSLESLVSLVSLQASLATPSPPLVHSYAPPTHRRLLPKGA